jgi:hypothetical protein
MLFFHVLTRSGGARLAPRLLLLVASVALVLLALEVAVRIASPDQVAPAFRALFMPDDRIGYRPRPGASGRYKTPEFEAWTAINNAGFRDDREIGPKPPDEFRIAVLGDSMVMAVQVPIEETFVRRLEGRLNGAGAARYRVINAGVQGYGTVEQALFYSHVVSAFEPDLVVLTVFVGNDAPESAAAEHRLRADAPEDLAEAAAGVALAAPESRVPVWLRRLSRRSALVQYMRLRVLAALGPTGPLPLRERGVHSYANNPPGDVLRGFAVSRDAAARIAGEVAGAGGRMAVVFLPARFQVVDRDFADLAAHADKDGMQLERDGASRRFRDAYAGLAIPQLDLLPHLRRLSDPETLYFGRNVHLTARGHAEVAAAVEAFLRAGHLLPEDAAR